MIEAGTCSKRDTALKVSYIAVEDTITWTGSTDTSWTNASNWDAGTVPNECSIVLIPGTGQAPTQPTISGSAVTVKRITIESSSGAQLKINGGGILKIQSD